MPRAYGMYSQNSKEYHVLDVGWSVGLPALWNSISVYIGPSPNERDKEKRKDRWE